MFWTNLWLAIIAYMLYEIANQIYKFRKGDKDD